jgi:hypothetical protein
MPHVGRANWPSTGEKEQKQKANAAQSPPVFKEKKKVIVDVGLLDLTRDPSAARAPMGIQANFFIDQEMLEYV